MKNLKEHASLLILRMGIIGELVGFLLSHKLWWAIPIVLFTVLLVILLMLGQSSGVPFIYPFF